MIDAKLLDKSLRMIEVIAPEAAPIDLLQEGELNLPIVQRAHGWTRRGGHPAVRQALVEQGRWQGPRPFVVLNTEAMAKYCEAADISFDSMLATVVCHEVAHLLPHTPAPDVEPDAGTLAVAKLAMYAASEATTFRLNGEPPWVGHEADFNRLALHLFCRATAAGFDLDLDALCCGPRYGLPSASRFLHRLGDEPERFAGATFAEIEAEPAPPAFVDFWLAATSSFQPGVN